MSKFGSRFGRPRMVSVEEMENEAADGAEVVELPGETTDAAVADVAEVAVTIDTGVADVEIAVNDADTLEEVITVAENAEAEGGLEPSAAEMAAITVESIYARVGVSKTAIASLESFSSTKTRVKATQIAIEDWKQKLKEIWAAVVAAMKKVYVFVMDFFKNLFDASGKIQARAVALEKKASTLSGEAKEAEIKATSSFKLLTENDKFNYQKVVNEGMSGLEHVSEKVSNLVATLETLAKNLIPMVEKQEAFDNFTIKGTTSTDKKDAPEGMAWEELVSFSNIKLRVLHSTSELKGKDAYNALANVKSNIQLPDLKAIKLEIVPTLSTAEITDAAKNVQKLSKNMRGNNAAKAALEKYLKAILADTERAGKLATDDKGAERSRYVSRAVIGSSNMLIKAAVQTNSISLKFAKAILDYAEASAAQYSTEKK